MAKNAVKLENFSKQLKEITALLEGSRECLLPEIISMTLEETRISSSMMYKIY